MIEESPFPQDAHVSEHAKPHTAEAIATLVSIMNSTVGTPHDATRIRAAEMLLNRAWGRPPQAHAITVSHSPEQLKLELSDDELLAIAGRGR